MPRRPSIDLLRGLVMVIMALDHTRDFVHAGAMAFQPEDLTQTTPIIFLTRWITHFCAPAFMFTAGLGAWLRFERDGSKAGLARFLFTRGLWLLLLEVTAIRFAFFFNITTSPIFLLVFWSIGMSLIALSLLVWLPYWATFAVSAAMVLFHNLLDPIRAESMGSSAWLWRLLHQPGPVTMDPLVIVGYPLIPWIGVMGLGFCAGRIYRMPDEQRRRVLFWLGLGLTVAFVALRVTNFYGDPRPWSPQPRPGFTLLSFLNTTKYPVSLQFLLMTLGPALMFLSWVDRARPSDRNPLLVFGLYAAALLRAPPHHDPPLRRRPHLAAVRFGAVLVDTAADARHATRRVPARLWVAPLGGLCHHRGRRADDVSDLFVVRAPQSAPETCVAFLLVAS